MKNLKFIILALVLALSLSLAAMGAEQRDVSFENSLAADLKGLGLFSGVSDSDFDLERAPSRTEVLVMLIRVLGEEKAALEGDFSHPFTDVPEWADPYVGYAYETGLTKGISDTKFGNDTANAATYLTFMLRALGYSDAKGDFKWDAPHTLAKGLGILPSCVDTENFWRADIVTVSYAALSAELKDSTTLLYEKLIEKEAFTAETLGKHYTATKLTDKENENKAVLSAEQIYADCSPAVFYIEIQSEDGTPLVSGSGFFIAESGIAVTNYHVVEGAKKAVVTLSGSGAKYDVSGIYYHSIEHDVAIIQVDGSGFSALDVNPLPVKGASTVYAIGSPKGLQNTISQGLVSNARRVLLDSTYIQTTAAISGGSSGGVLLNVYGEAIGITSAEIADGQNLNFARPVSYIAPAKTDVLTPLGEVNWNYAKYELDAEEYTLKAGEKLTFEFDVTFNTVDGNVPQFNAVSDNPDVCVAVAAYGDTFVNIAAVAPGTATVTLSDNYSDDSITFTVTVTDGEVKEKPYVEYFADVESVGLNKGAKKTIRISAIAVGIEEDIKLNVHAADSTVLKVSNLVEHDGYVTVDVAALKRSNTKLVLRNDKTYDEIIIPVNVGEQFYIAFDAIKNYAAQNGELVDIADAEDYYFVEGRTYANGDVTNILYYPESDKICLRATSLVSSVTFDMVLTRESESTGKNIMLDIKYPSAGLHIKASFDNITAFGNGNNHKMTFDEFVGPENTKDLYRQILPGLVVVLLYEFDMWFDYILPETDMSDLGFVSLDYEHYGVTELG